MDKKHQFTDELNRQNNHDLYILHKYRHAREAVEEIRTRHTLLNDRFRQHCDKHWVTWARAEQERIFQKRFRHIRPEYQYKHQHLTREEAQKLCFNEARENVNNRIRIRQARLEQAAQNMRRDILDNAHLGDRQQGLARQYLDQEVKEIHQTIHRQRMDAYRDYKAHKSERIEAAKQALSASPQQDVYDVYRQQDRQIISKKEHMLQQAYERFGFNYLNEAHLLKKQFNMDL